MSLVIAIGDLKNNPDYAWVYLAGSSVLSGVVGVKYSPGVGDGKTVTEEMTIILRGTNLGLSTAIQSIENMVKKANLFTEKGFVYPIYIRVQHQVDAAYYYSRILFASIEPGPNALQYSARGSLGIILKFTRQDFWFKDEAALVSSNVNGSSSAIAGLVVNNSDEAGTDNFFSVPLANFSTDLPAIVSLKILNSYATGTLKDIFIGSFQYDALGSLPTLYYEGEDGTGGTDTVSADCSGGYLNRLTWSTAAWADLVYWSITSSNVTKFKNRMVMPIIRLGSVLAEAAQLKLVLKAGSITLYESPVIYANAGIYYVKFNPIRIPPNMVSSVVSTVALELHLYAYKNDTTTDTIDVDFILLMPLDTFAHYQSIDTLSENDYLVDDGLSDFIYSVKSGYESPTHIPVLSNNRIFTKNNAKFVVFLTNSSDQCEISRQVTILPKYRSCLRVL
jgi:hypothetical protein